MKTVVKETHDFQDIPYISIIIPVYNSEKYIKRCLNSAIFQTMQNIEIIVVYDDGNEDKTVDIVELYMQKFPEKIRCIKSEKRGLSPAREYGLANARGEYICFVDVDDYIDYRLCDMCLQEIQEHEAEVVAYNYRRYSTNENSLNESSLGAYVNSQKIGDSIALGAAGFWKFIAKKEFIEKNVEFYDMYWEDAAAIPAMLARVKNFRLLTDTLYFYTNNEDALSNSIVRSDRILEHAKADQLLLDTIGNKYFMQACVRTSRRMLWPFSNHYFLYYDFFLEHLKKYSWIYSFEQDVYNKLTAFEKRLYNHLMTLEEIKFPSIIYVNAFGKKPNSEYIENAQKTFWNLEQIIYLDETNCNVEENEIVYSAYNEKRYEFVGEFFALKNIYENGGVYISDRVIMNATFNKMRYDECFFGFEADKKILKDVFGGAKGNLILRAILNTYYANSSEKNINLSFAERIAMVLVAYSGVKLNGNNQQGLHNVHIYPMTAFTINCNNRNQNICYIDYKNSEDILCISKETFQAAINLYETLLKNERKKINTGINNKSEQIIIENTGIDEEYLEQLEYNTYCLGETRKSKSYKIGLWVTAIPRILKAILIKIKVIFKYNEEK